MSEIAFAHKCLGDGSIKDTLSLRIAIFLTLFWQQRKAICERQIIGGNWPCRDEPLLGLLEGPFESPPYYSAKHTLEATEISTNTVASPK